MREPESGEIIMGQMNDHLIGSDILIFRDSLSLTIGPINVIHCNAATFQNASLIQPEIIQQLALWVNK